MEAPATFCARATRVFPVATEREPLETTAVVGMDRTGQWPAGDGGRAVSLVVSMNLVVGKKKRFSPRSRGRRDGSVVFFPSDHEDRRTPEQTTKS